MKKNIPVSKKSLLINKFKRYKKQLAGVAIVLLVLVAAGGLVLHSRKDATVGITPTLELAKSPVNIETTKLAENTAPGTTTTENATNSPTPTAASNVKKTTTPATTTPNATTPSTTSNIGTTPATPPAAEPFAVNSAINSNVDNNTPTLVCNDAVRLTFTGYITANGAGTVTYHWERSDGAASANRQLVFTEAGYLPVTNTWDFVNTGTAHTGTESGWYKVVVTSPNAAASKPSDATFTITYNCAV